VQLTDFIGQRSFSRCLLVEAEAEGIGVESEAVDEIAASTSLDVKAVNIGRRKFGVGW